MKVGGKLHIRLAISPVAVFLENTATELSRLRFQTDYKKKNQLPSFN